MICEFCGYEFSDDLGRYGCPNCEGEGMGEETTQQPLYSVGTWDEELQSYTPQIGLTVPAFNITIGQLRQAVRDLRRLGYTAHRKRDPSAGDEALMYEDNDWSVRIERTDGRPAKEIMRDWMMMDEI